MGCDVLRWPAIAVALSVCSLCSFTIQANAVPLAVPNPSFQAPDKGASGDFSNNEITSWVGSSATNFSYGVYVVPPANYSGVSNGIGGLATPDGDQAAYLSLGNISTTLSDTLQAGTYTLTLWVGNRGDLGGFPNLSIALLAGGTAYDTQVVSSPPGEGKWTQKSFVFDVALGDSSIGALLGIQLLLTGGSGQANFDLVQLDFEAAAPPPSGVPLPAALPLFATGLGLLGGAGYWRRKRGKTA
jgi:hypothetical protein